MFFSKTGERVRGDEGKDRYRVPLLLCCGSAGRPERAQLSEPVQQHRADAEGQWGWGVTF